MKTIRRYFNNAEAEFQRTLLLSVGIEAVLADENANILGPGYAQGGVRLQVPDEDVEHAIEILDGNHEEFTPLPDGFVPPEEDSATEESVPPPVEGFAKVHGLIPSALCVLAAMGAIYALFMLLAPLNWTHSSAELIRMGNAASDRGDYAKAGKCYDAALIVNPRSYKAFYDRGLVFLKTKHYEKAITDFTEAINLNSQYTISYRMRAYTYQELGYYDNALDDINKAIHLDPENYRSYRFRGYVYSKMSEAARAIEDYNRAIRLAPEQWVAYSNLAWLYATSPKAEVRNGAKALELATKACELSSWKGCYCIGALAAAEAETGKFDDAVKHQLQALALAKADKAADGKKLDQMADALAAYQQKTPYRDVTK